MPVNVKKSEAVNCVRHVDGVTTQKTVAFGDHLLVKTEKYFGAAQNTVEHTVWSIYLRFLK